MSLVFCLCTRGGEPARPLSTIQTWCIYLVCSSIMRKTCLATSKVSTMVNRPERGERLSLHILRLHMLSHPSYGGKYSHGKVLWTLVDLNLQTIGMLSLGHGMACLRPVSKVSGSYSKMKEVVRAVGITSNMVVRTTIFQGLATGKATEQDAGYPGGSIPVQRDGRTSRGERPVQQTVRGQPLDHIYSLFT